MTTFADIGVAKKFLDALEPLGYVTPTPIQEQSIPVVLEGKDVFGIAQTGTGKTGAFSLPMLQRLDATHQDNVSTKGKKTHIRALILAPTRELANQICENIRSYSTKCNLRTAVIYGGVSQNPQIKKLRKGVEILVATPGRLLDLINQKHVNLHFVETLILDEADRMLDMGFIRDIKKIVNYTPKTRQTLFFSATSNSKVNDLAKEFLIDPVHIAVSPDSSTVDTVSQYLYTMNHRDKNPLLIHLLTRTEIKNAVVFTRTKHRANKVEKLLRKEGISCAAIHGNKSQNARQKSLQKLKDGSIRVLVATDVAARGIDVNELSHVIIYDVPVEPEAYVHRIGRTGRAGEEGDALMFCEPEEKKYLNAIIKLIGKEIPLIIDHPFHMDISSTTTTSSRKYSRSGSKSRKSRYTGSGNRRGRSQSSEKEGSRKRKYASRSSQTTSTSSGSYGKSSDTKASKKSSTGTGSSGFQWKKKDK